MMETLIVLGLCFIFYEALDLFQSCYNNNRQPNDSDNIEDCTYNNNDDYCTVTHNKDTDYLILNEEQEYDDSVLSAGANIRIIDDIANNNLSDSRAQWDNCHLSTGVYSISGKETNNTFSG